MSKEIINLDECLAAGQPLPDIQALDGERWFPKETTIVEDMPVYWGGDFGCSSECNEIGYHGWEHEDRLDMTMEEEEQNMEKAEAVFQKLIGKKPIGARGCWNVTHEFTPQLLRTRGYSYSSIMKNCDYAWIYPGEEEAPLVELPVDHSCDDVTFFYFTFNTPEHRSNYPIGYVFDYWKDIFDELASEEDKIMVLKLHPQLIGRASRSVLLDRFLTYAEEHDAWIAPCCQVADYVKQFGK